MDQIFIEAAKELPSLVVLMLGVSYFLNYMKEDRKEMRAAMDRNTKALIKFTALMRVVAIRLGREDLVNDTEDEDEPPDRPSSMAGKQRRRRPNRSEPGRKTNPPQMLVDYSGDSGDNRHEDDAGDVDGGADGE